LGSYLNRQNKKPERTKKGSGCAARTGDKKKTEKVASGGGKRESG